MPYTPISLALKLFQKKHLMRGNITEKIFFLCIFSEKNVIIGSKERGRDGVGKSGQNKKKEGRKKDSKKKKRNKQTRGK